MKKLTVLIGFISIFSISFCSGQVTLNMSELSVDEGITEEEKTNLIALVRESFINYFLVSKLLSSNDAERFSNFYANNVLTFNDLEKNPLNNMIHPLIYVDQAIDKFPEGIDFQISDAKFLKLGIDESFDNFAIITFKKLITSAQKIGSIETEQRIVFTINSITGSVQISKISGNIVQPTIPQEEVVVEDTNKKEDTSEKDNMETVIAETKPNSNQEDIVEENPEDIVIIDQDEPDDKENQLNESGLVFNQKERFLSINAGMGFGSLKLGNRVENYPFDSDMVSSSWNSVPLLNLQFANSIGNRRKIFWNIAVQYEQTKIETDISSFRHSAQSQGLLTSASVLSAESNGINNDFAIGIEEEASIRILNQFGGSINGGKEVIELSALSFMGGISYKLYRSPNNLSYLFGNIAIGASIIQPRGTNNISYLGSIENGVKLPTSSLFPILEIEANNYDDIKDSNGNILSEYETSEVNTLNLSSKTETTTNFLTKLGVSYMRKLNYDIGLIANFNYIHSLTPIFSNEEVNTSFLEGDASNWNETSIIERYHDNVSLGRFEFSLGVFLWFN